MFFVCLLCVCVCVCVYVFQFLIPTSSFPAVFSVCTELDGIHRVGKLHRISPAVHCTDGPAHTVGYNQQHCSGGPVNTVSYNQQHCSDGPVNSQSVTISSTILMDL